VYSLPVTGAGSSPERKFCKKRSLAKIFDKVVVLLGESSLRNSSRGRSFKKEVLQ